jgi:hypothetical protein
VAKDSICLEYDSVSLGNQILLFQDKFAMKLQANAENSLSDLIQQSLPSTRGTKIHIRSHVIGNITFGKNS